MNIEEKLGLWAEKEPMKQALMWRTGSFTYGELNRSVNRLAGGLVNIGVKKGDRVAVQLMNDPEFVVSYLALFRIGAILVPMNPLYTEREIQIILSDAQPVAVITSSKFVSNILNIREQISSLQKVIVTDGVDLKGVTGFTDLLDGASDSWQRDYDIDHDELAEIIYTSGTTGIPKGAMLTHNNLTSNIKTLVEDSLKLTSQERTLIVAPLFHIAAQTNCMATTLNAGGTVYLEPRWESTKQTLQALQDYHITYFFGPPTMITLMLNDPDFKSYDLSAIRVIIVGAAALPSEIFKKYTDLFGFEPMEGYGLSETSPVVTFNPIDGLKKPGSIGLPIKGIEVKIFDNNDVELPPGQVGEIVVKGPNVFKGYWNKPEESKEALRNGWFHTGDLAYKDDDGYIFIVDRKKDVVIRGGLNIYPREVEEILYTHPAVLEVAVIGVPDQVMGEELKAFMTVKGGQQVDFAEIKKFCLKYIAQYKVPKFYEVLDSLPKTVSGKILKTELRKAAAGTGGN
ncbi:long-chain fatty acid--CoA ligase [Paradesulfitobacterium aromaticivorans]